MINIDIMGFGRIGRNIFRFASDSERFKISAIGDIADPEILHYLLSSESNKDNQFHLENNYLWG